MKRTKCSKISWRVRRAASDLSKKNTSKRNKSQAGRTLNNHKKKYH